MFHGGGGRKPSVNKRERSNFKYGLEIPVKYKDAVRIDIAYGSMLWQMAVQEKIAALIFHDCFTFKPKGFKLSNSYQFAPLVLNFELKQDLRCKARLVIQGFRVNPKDLSTQSTVVQGISVRLIGIIAHRDDLQLINGNIGNDFLQTKTNEKFYTICEDYWG